MQQMISVTLWFEEVHQDRYQVEKTLQSCIIPVNKKRILH